MYKADKTSSQFRLVILLLAIAVILPTVCLLWFMTQAVKNERLAVRQKLIDVYSKKVKFHLTSSLSDGCKMDLSLLRLKQSHLEKAPWGFGQMMISPAMVVYDEQEQLVWPLVDDNPPDFIESQLYTKAQGQEYVDHDYPAALQSYKELADSSSTDISDRIKMSIARCYLKMDDVKNAQNIYKEISYPAISDSDDYEYASVCKSDMMRARVALAELYTNSGNADLQEYLKQSLLGVVSLDEINQYRTLLFTPDVWIWGLNRLIGLAEKNELDLKWAIGRARQRIKEQEYCSLVSYVYSYEKVRDLEPGIVTSLETESVLYGIKAEVEGWQVLLIADTDTFVKGYLWGQWDQPGKFSPITTVINGS